MSDIWSQRDLRARLMQPEPKYDKEGTRNPSRFTWLWITLGVVAAVFAFRWLSSAKMDQEQQPIQVEGAPANEEDNLDSPN